MSAQQTCRGCGCTETTPCETPSGPCHWVEPGLCSACAQKKQLQLTPEDLAALKTMPPMRVQIGGVEAMMLLSALQLALRHPHFDTDGPVCETVEQFACALQEHVSATPGLAAICDAGWDPKHDVAPEKYSGLILPGDPRFAL